MSKDIQKQMDKFYERYQTIEGLENADIFESYIMRKYKKEKNNGTKTEEEYNEKLKEIKNNELSNKNSISLSKRFQEMSEEKLKMFPASLTAYKSIINSTAQLCHELGLDDSMDIFVVFNYLLWNGYFSKDKDYFYTMAGRTNMFGYYGADIINGQGVCLNKSHMLDSLFKTMNYESHMVFNKVDKKMTLAYKTDIERKIKNQGESSIKIWSLLLEPISNITGNHACTLVKKDNVYYAYDPTNLCVFKLDDFLQANIIGGTGSITIKPYSLSLFENLNNRKIVEIVDSYKNVGSEIQPYDIDIVKTSFEENLELCRNNTALFNDFHIENELNRNMVLEMFKKTK